MSKRDGHRKLAREKGRREDAEALARHVGDLAIDDPELLRSLDELAEDYRNKSLVINLRLILKESPNDRIVHLRVSGSVDVKELTALALERSPRTPKGDDGQSILYRLDRVDSIWLPFESTRDLANGTFICFVEEKGQVLDHVEPERIAHWIRIATDGLSNDDLLESDDETDVEASIMYKARSIYLASETMAQAATLLAPVASTSSPKSRPLSRSELPIDAHEDSIVQSIQCNTVTLVSGATGSGKSTRVPQFILDADAQARIVVTQPRRIAAMSLAERVHSERETLPFTGEQEVGYSVRLDAKTSGANRCVFLTVGVLLRRLAFDPTLRGVTHVCIDEVHERDLLTDMMIAEVKLLLSMRPELRVVLMSATMNDALFLSYFEPCTRAKVEVEGRTFPVQAKFLPVEVASDAEGDPEDALEKERLNMIESIVSQHHRSQTGAPGAVLIFVAGLADITAIVRHLESRLRPREDFHLQGLHSSMSTEEQRKCFQRLPGNVVKIIVSTNIAETSLTIEDVTLVIDTARVKRLVYDPDSRVTTLKETLVAKSEAIQRRGRAGRTSPGTCIHFIRSMDDLPEDAPLPEMQRVGLQSAVIHTKLARPEESSFAFFASCPSPPSPSHVRRSLRDLVHLGVLGDAVSTKSDSPAQGGGEDIDHTRLTPLGYNLIRLPLDPRVAKLTWLGRVLGIPDAAVVAASILEGKSLFLTPVKYEKQQIALRAKMKFDAHSDVLASVLATFEWRASVRGAHQEKEWLRENWISRAALNSNEILRQDILYNHSFDDSAKRFNTKDAKSLLPGLLTASLYPNVVSPSQDASLKCAPHPASSVVSGLFPKNPNLLYVYHRAVRPGTSNLPFLHGVTMGGSKLALILFAGSGLNIDWGGNKERRKGPKNGIVTIRLRDPEQSKQDYEFIPKLYFRCKRRLARALLSLRRLLDDVLLESLEGRVSELGKRVLETVRGLLAWERKQTLSTLG